MSYDVYVGGNGGENYTSNITRMLYDGDGFYWPDYDDQRLPIVAQRLDILIEHMEQDPERFERHNPANGWGDYRTCLDWLRRLRDQCRETMQYSRDPWREFVRVSW